ncbi:MAG: mannonate dehydratase [Caldilineaceae bacterium]|nr:mannonate dehydratase [Caldilineaceae bacterium]
MLRISVFSHNAELTDTYLRQRVALGADAIDFGGDREMPGVAEQGYPDLGGVRALRRRLRALGMDINRVTLPNLSNEFVENRVGAEDELENVCKALRVYGEARIPIARQRVEGDVFNQMMQRSQTSHRGGYLARAETLVREAVEIPSAAQLQKWWDRFCYAFERMVPIAEEYDIKLAVHPSDTPNVDTPFGGIGFHRVIDAFPSPNVGYVYCIGTRAEAGGSALVIDEINNYGRKGKIFMVHMRNVRGSLATSGGYEETLLDDGDLNMMKILRELVKIGFDGCINPDHIPSIPGDNKTKDIGWGYSIGYVRALITALVA